MIFLGFEISDVLRISDKDYSVTFGLYFSVEWFEPRLNLSRDLWGEGRVASDTELIPGECALQCQAEDEHPALEPGFNIKRCFGFTRSRCRREGSYSVYLFAMPKNIYKILNLDVCLHA